MMIKNRGLKRLLLQSVASAAALVVVATPAAAVDFEYSGYARAHFSMNLSDNASWEDGVTAKEIGGKGELSMARFSGKIESSWDFGAFKISSVFRVSEEHDTDYVKDLDDATKLGPLAVINHAIGAAHPLALVGAAGLTGIDFGAAGAAVPPIPPGGAVPAGVCRAAAAGPFCDTTPFTGMNASLFGAGANKSFAQEYDQNRFHDMMRELYVTFDAGERTHVKLGKQQVVWGETDFFRAMDIVHGYDLTWRAFLEGENEELRKPLILANFEIEIPELGGTLQLIYRPGWDEGKDVGTSVPLNGSRWAPQPLAGLNLLNSSIGPANYHHSAGDENDENFGIRWTGLWNQIGYSLAYWKGLDNDPIVVRNPLLGGSTNYGTWDPKATATGETISAEIETFAVSMNAYVESMDIVGRAELAFTPNKPYNSGTDTFVDLLALGLGCNDAGLAVPGVGNCGAFGGAFGPPVRMASLRNNPLIAASAYDPLTSTDGGIVLSVPGLGEVVEKDTLRIMLGFDKNLNTQKLLGTQRPSFWTVQLFDTWIVNFDKDDDIVDLFGYGSAKREHSTILTNAIVLNYDYDTINPGLAVGVDLGNFDMFIIPSVDLVFGDHWRVRLEADIFLPRNSKAGNTGFIENDTRLLGTLDDNDQLVARITYQF